MAKQKAATGQQEAEKSLIAISRLTQDEIFSRYRTDEDGLNQVEAAERLEEYGPNIIDVGNENRLFQRIKDALINPFNIVLIIVAAVTLVTDVIIADDPNWATFIMLVAVILISGVISFVQSEKSNNAAQKLQHMITNKIDVIRNGSSMEISIEEVVPGDVVKLASGISALIAALALQVLALSNDTAETATGIDYSAGVEAAQKMGLRMTMTIIPIIGLVFAFFWFKKKYILTDEKIEEIAEQLKASGN